MKKIKFNFNKLQQNKWLWFAIYASLATIFIYVINDIIITDPKYYTGGNDNSVNLFRNVYKIIYFTYPIYLFLRILIISLFLKAGLSFFKVKKVKLIKPFMLVLITEFVLLIPDFIEIIWFLFIHTGYTMEEVSNFSFLSLNNIIDTENISSAYSYPISLLNLFEVIYWFLLIVGIKELTGKSSKQSFKIVASSYGMMLILIIVFRFVLFSMILHY